MHRTPLLFSIYLFFLIGIITSLPAESQSLPEKARSLLKFGDFGTANGKFILPMGIAIDKNDNIYVVDHQNHRIQKFNSSGKFLSKFGSFGTGNGQFNWPIDIDIDAQGNIYVADRDNHRIQKFNSNGQFISKFGSLGTADGQLISPYSIAVDGAGNMYIANRYHGHNIAKNPTPRIDKFNSHGQFVLAFGSQGTADGQFITNDIALDTNGNVYIADGFNRCIKKFTSSGQFLFKFGSKGTGDGQFIGIGGIAIDPAGNIYVSDREVINIQKFNSKGQLLLKFGKFSYEEGQFLYPVHIAVDAAGNLYVVDDPYVKKFAIEEAVLTPNYVKGTVYNDTNEDCVQDTAEKGIEGMIVVAQPGNHYTSTDSLGNYTLAVDTGSYTIKQLIPNNKSFIKQICPINPATHSVRFTASNDSVLGKNFANQLMLQPYLSVNVLSDRRRRCMTNMTTVSYCNSGTAAATNVKVYVKLPEYVVFKSANSAYTVDKDSNYVFTIESLTAGTCGSIEIQDSVICADIQGLIQCTSAWITPANSRTLSPDWDQSDIQVKASCTNNGKVRLSIYNNGSGSMADSSAFRIYLDAQLAYMNDFKLAKGDSLILQVPTNGQTVRLEAAQRPDHPSRKLSFITIEACGINSNGTVSKGYVTQQVQEEEESEISTECLPIIDSFDPNDKAVSPQGVSNEHYTPTNTALDYTIRFQNTGTDTAYKVLVVDTLSEHLDMKTLQIAAVSHAYKLSVSGKGKPVLTFTFNNINLPDSTKDQAGSNGFIRFSIRPKVDLPEKTRIENFADIFFDFNKPVRTNTTFNSIYDIPLVVEESAKLDQRIVCLTTNTTVQAGISRIVCGQDTVVMQAIAPLAGKGQWKLMSGKGIFQDRESGTTIISGLAYGENVFEWSVSANSCGIDSLHAQVTITRQMKPATPVIRQQGTDSLICSIAGSSYEWFLQGAVIDKHTQSIQVKQAGLYTVKVTNQFGCSSDTSATFEYVLPCYITNISINAGSDQVICEQDTIILQAAGPIQGKGIWKLVSGQGVIQNTQAANSLVKVLSYGENVFEWKVSSTTCSDSLKAQVTITRVQKPITPVIIQVGADSLVCSIAGDSYQWQLEGVNMAINSQQIKADIPGKYTVRVKNQQDCLSDLSAPFTYVLTATDSYLSTLIKVYPNPTTGKISIILPADFGQEVEISVWDALGRNVMNKNLTTNSNQYKEVFDLSTEKSGVYLLKIQTSKGVTFRRIIKK
ncbi:T9SS type A sorting domain-containing protein [Rhodocytophaga rosea]|uniref:T9SS type A sorting domain-containing protein n=1 Tax=Rhodocytophaga rosea TaxID=2704465 RepID=A0A6C0GGZ1_9BACT|nr:T9SS type A sorting domain-containing protein [Rhodocytophaga rosea]QHT67189.1 T9SS type A sorting domain-containing protein [Rhodocytophaga rosea]